MSQRKKRNKKNKKKTTTSTSEQNAGKNYSRDPAIQSALNAISERRTGGSANVKGLNFQLLYSCFRILSEFKNTSSSTGIRLEGIEDVDILDVGGNKFIQLKTSVNTINAGSFWEMGVLQNFFEVYREDDSISLLLVHDSSFAHGKLSNLPDEFNHWKGKFENADIDISHVDFRKFLSSIRFESYSSEEALIDGCKNLIIQDFNVSVHATNQFLIALFYSVFNWSKQRQQINRMDVLKVFQEVEDSFSKHPENIAIRDNLIEIIKFDSHSILEDSGYWEGKSARPYHIANNLPVKRPYWENEIDSGVGKFDVVVIKSSSGQGKSTLGWMHSKEQSEAGYSIFEIKKCSDQQEVAAISDYLISRLKIGLRPLVVIDGLSKRVSEWEELAQISHQYPIKFLVTTREEDWIRYGGNISRLNLGLINIHLDQDEAKEIFKKLNSSNQLHPGIESWEPAWEKVSEKKLLIEFVYLLTKGQMIEERVNHQITQLNKEDDGKPKLEILRIISAADIINLKIKTNELVSYIESKIGFKQDRGEVLLQLENEYYLKFEDRFVEGLHPVRSYHLFNRLHKSISSSDTLLNLFDLLHEDDLYDFAKGISLQISELNGEFYEKLATKVSEKKFSEMVWTFDGLLHAEPQKYWTQNKEVFDTAFENGGLKLFSIETTPFREVNALTEFEKILGAKAPGISRLILLKNKLTKFELDESNLIFFAKSLNQSLKNRDIKDQKLEGLGSLIKWIKELKLTVSISIGELEDDEYLLRLLDNSPLEEVSEAFSYFYENQKASYRAFVERNKYKIISFLKIKTNSLTIEEIEADISIEYLIDDSDAERVNELSVFRIQTVSSFLPFYERYRTKVLVLPFPNEEINSVIVQNSTKAMPLENIQDTFNVHLNQIWTQTIEDNYRANSFYDWQKFLHELRKENIEFVKRAIRFFEDWLEKKHNRFKSSARNLDSQAEKLRKLLIANPEAPRVSSRYYDKDPFVSQYKEISGWLSSVLNVVNQYGLIINPQQQNDRNVAKSNLHDIISKLGNFQIAVDEISKSNHHYFDTHEIINEENDWFPRLLKTVEYFILYHKSVKPIGTAKNVINYWAKRSGEEEIKKLHKIIQDFEKDSYFKFYLPSRILNEGCLRTAIIGVDYIDPEMLEEDTLELFIGLKDLAGMNLDFFTFVNVLNRTAIGGFRANRDFIERVKHTVETGEEFEVLDYGNPIPIIPEPETVEVLGDVRLSRISTDDFNKDFGRVMFNIWKISEYRIRLDVNSKAEMDWLEEMEKDYFNEIDMSLRSIKNKIPENEYLQAKALRDKSLKRKDILKDEVIELLNYRLETINREVLHE